MAQPTKKSDTKTSARTVALIINKTAHVDRADLPNGVVTKTQVLSVPKGVAKELLRRYPYLTTLED